MLDPAHPALDRRQLNRLSHGVGSVHPSTGALAVARIPAIKSVMTPFPYFVQRSAPIGDALSLMREHAVRHLPVVHASELVGVITDRDIKLFLGPELGSPNPRNATVEDACQEDCYVVDLNAPLDVVAGEMAERHIGSALVTRNGKLAGVFTVTDACRCLAQILGGNRPAGPDEAA